LTRGIIKLLNEKGIKHQVICEPGRTHTNNEGVLISGQGVRTAVLSVPLKNMHTPCETVNLEDIKSLAQILCAIAYEENL
jgi:endoglucanase